MKDRIIDSIGKIDDDMIESVDALRQSPKKRPQKNNHIMGYRTISLAACLCLIVGVFAIVLHIGEVWNDPQPVYSSVDISDVVYLGRTYADEDDFIIADVCEKYAAKEYTDTNAPQNMTIEFLGKSYEAVYMNSARYALSDKRVLVYSLDGEKYGPRFYIDSETMNTVGGIMIPYELPDTKEDTMRSVIKEIIGDRLNLDDCDVEIFTNYGISGEDSYHVTTKKGFIIPQNEDAHPIHAFFYTKQCSNGFMSEEQAEFQFSELGISYQIIEAENTKDCQTPSIEEIETKAKAYLMQHLNKKYSVTNMDVESISLRHIDNTDLIVVNITVTFICGETESILSEIVGIELS